MAQNVGRYVFAIDRREVSAERIGELNRLAAEAGLSPEIRQIFSGANERREGIARQIEEAGQTYFDHPHVILIITHAGMMTAEFDHYDGWDAIIIDEIPSILEHEVHATSPADLPFLRSFYEIEPGPDGSYVRFKGGFSKSDIERPSTRHWRNFHKLVVAGGARVSLESWSQTLNRKAWSAWRVWSFTRLAPFGEVRIMGDAFTETETFHLMEREGGFTFLPFAIGEPRAWTRRPVTIRYFSEDVLASGSLFGKDWFQLELRKAASWLGSACSADRHLFTSNLKLGSLFTDVPGTAVSPKQAGTNRWRDCTEATAIYSAKPSPQEIVLFGGMGIDPSIITTSRESYDLKQFVMRTDMRNPDSAQPITIHVVDKHQAEMIGAYLGGAYNGDVTLEWLDLNMAFKAPEAQAAKPRGRPPSGRAKSKEERQAQKNEGKRRQRARERAEREARGEGSRRSSGAAERVRA